MENLGLKCLLLLTMIFCHIVDDYYLQGCLASLKQKSWWKKNWPEDMYRHDYLAALFMHSFSWSFMIMLVPTIYTIICGGIWSPVAFATNLVVHMIVDDMKANKKKINLIQDQAIHMIQILATWCGMILL